jgi:D-tagatose-1,6-bisphosphate aldolase subunit GatZ/KbaZ
VLSWYHKGREPPVELIGELKKRLEENKRGLPRGVYSICSAHRTVLEAAMLQARADRSFLLVESTSNQVNQYGGYTGMTPARFVAYVTGIAELTGFPGERIIFGGDHLGPNVWQGERAAAAMEKAKVLVRDYIQAGYGKIHLDASMFCADDEGDRGKPLPDTTVADRVVELCGVCETAWASGPGREKPVYVIGTEVPVPGGSREKEGAIRPTSGESLGETVGLTQKAFFNAGLEEPWNRVIAVVAQPGVEFGDDFIFYYDSGAAGDLSRALEKSPLVFEAHSTDYQPQSCLRKLVEDHFCILKVGPWLTYGYREAVFSLARMEDALFDRDSRSNLEEVLEETMLNSVPNYWENYYRGTEAERRFCRKYSLSDRSRYYWTNPRLQGAVEKLLANLSGRDLPLSLISQYMPDLFMPVNEGRVKKTPRDLIIAHIRGITGLYAEACGFREGGL